MDLGLAFDDDDLNTTREKTRDDINLPYSVKTCSPQWFESVVESYQQNFMDTAAGVDLEQIPQIFKFSGDFHYHKQNYKIAAERYKRSLELLPENNVLMRIDVKESLCRCYLYCGQTSESLQIARDMVSEMSNQDEMHQRQALLLLSTVCEKMERWAECVECLEKLCTRHPFFAQCWDGLGDAYMKLYSHPSVENGIFTKEEAVNGGGHLDSEIQIVRPLTCYIRASLLCQSVMGNASGLVKTRNKVLIAKISKKIEELPFSEAQKTSAFHHIQEQFDNQELNSEDKLEGSSNEPLIKTTTDISNVSYSELFYDKFCSWYRKSKTK